MITSRIRDRTAAPLWARRLCRVSRILPAVAALAALAAGCATVPSSGLVQQVGAGQPGVSQEQNYLQWIPVGPKQGWKPEDIVQGFLKASASFADNHAVAREYLDSSAQRSWKPGWAVTVVSSLTVTTAALLPRTVTNQSEQLARVRVTGQPVATLNDSGQYLVSSGPPSESYFTLDKTPATNFQWRIDGLPSSSQLLLTQADFQQVYQSRSLYYLNASGRALVPDPVFVPQQATNTELATGLVSALLKDPVGWLAGAATTGFPARTRLLGQVRIDGPNATVDLGGGAAKASHQQRAQMAAQLAWTLATGPIQSVALQISNRPVWITGSAYQTPQAYQTWVPAQAAGASLYFVGVNGTVQAVSGAAQSGPAQQGSVGPVSGAAGTPVVPALSSIAVSPDGHWIAGIAAEGKAVYTGALSRGAQLQEWQPTPPGLSCTSLSWDSQDNLWVTGGGDVWMLLRDGSASPSADLVTPPSLPPSDQVTDFQVAPDGVRAVMLVRAMSNGKPVTQLELAAISRSGTDATVGQPVIIGVGVTNPEALTWYGPDNVIVLAGTRSGPQLEEVPLNGGPGTPIPSTGDPLSVTASSPQGAPAEIAVGLPGGKIMVSTNSPNLFGTFEPARAVGESPVYPG